MATLEKKKMISKEKSQIKEQKDEAERYTETLEELVCACAHSLCTCRMPKWVTQNELKLEKSLWQLYVCESEEKEHRENAQTFHLVGLRAAQQSNQSLYVGP